MSNKIYVIQLTEVLSSQTKSKTNILTNDIKTSEFQIAEQETNKNTKLIEELRKGEHTGFSTNFERENFKQTLHLKYDVK